MRKARLNKIYKDTVQRWRDDWEKLYDYYDAMPYALKVLIDKQKQTAILQPLLHAGEEDKQAIDAKLQVYLEELMQELELDHKAWEKWADALDDLNTLDANHDHPDLTQTPDKLPSPPQDPRSSLLKVKRWDYPETIEGLVQQHVASYIFFADAVERYKSRLSWARG